MRILATLGFASAVLATACSAPQPAAAPPREAAPVEVAFERGIHGHVLVPVTVDARQTLFLLDTGASGDGLSPAFASTLGLAHTGSAEAIAAGGTAGDVPMVTLPAMRIGGLLIPSHPGSVEEFDPEEPRVGGIFGRDLFTLRDVEVDLGKNRLRLFAPGTSRERADLAAPAFSRLAFADAMGLAKIDVRLDGGAPIAAIVDLGASQSVVSLEAARLSGFVPAANATDATAVGADGHPIAMTVHAFSSLRVGEIDIGAPKVVVGDLPVLEALGLKGAPAVVLGLDLLAGRVLVFDYAHKEIVVSRVTTARTS